jgi:excisionase family DNA binding protein
MEPLTLSVSDTARALGLGRTSIYAMIKDNRLETVKFGRRTLITSASLRRFVEAR